MPQRCTRRAHANLGLIILGFGLLLSPPAVADTLVVATFNAEFLTRPRVHVKFGLPLFESQWEDQADIEAWSDPVFRDARYSEAAQAVGAVIAGIDADVIVLTEVGNLADVTELRDEVERLGVDYDHLRVCSCTDRTTAQHVAILSKLTIEDVAGSIPGREGFDAELDESGEEESHTGVSKGMKARIRWKGDDFHIYGLHLKSERGGHESDAQRVAQASIVRRDYLDLLEQPGHHVIVAGDLNDGRGGPALRRIRGRDDIWDDLLQTGMAQYFPGAEETRWTYEFRGVREQLDHVLASRSVDQRGSITAEVPDQPDRLASDHRPFVIRIEFP